MANYFVDSTTGDDGDNGTTMDLAWATVDYAIESGGLTAGDILWVRRLHSETLSSTINVTFDGTAENPIRVIGWPRNSDASITQADWTNGSTTVDNIVGLSMDREKHLGRYVTAPDGETYMITRIVDSNTIVILKEYAGATVTGTNGACTIQADEDYDLAQAIDDSGWTIKVSDWTGDADDLPLIDCDSAYYFYVTGGQFTLYDNIDFLSGTSYAVRVSGSRSVGFRGCLFQGTGNAILLYVHSTSCHIERCVIVGDGTQANQNGVGFVESIGSVKDLAVYNTGDNALYVAYARVCLENVNLGVEVATPTQEEINVWYWVDIYARDLKLGANVGQYERAQGTMGVWNFFSIENFNQVLGAHKTFNSQGEIVNAAVVAGSGDPYKRTGGADEVIEILYDQSTTAIATPSPHKRFAAPIFTHEFEAPSTDRRKYRYYVQAQGAVTADQLWIECEYVSAYDDTSEYVIKKVTSDESITIRTGASDWSQYIEVTGIQPAVGSTVRIKCYCRYYHATNKIYIDPLPEVTV